MLTWARAICRADQSVRCCSRSLKGPCCGYAQDLCRAHCNLGVCKPVDQSWSYFAAFGELMVALSTIVGALVGAFGGGYVWADLHAKVGRFLAWTELQLAAGLMKWGFKAAFSPAQPALLSPAVAAGMCFCVSPNIRFMALQRHRKLPRGSSLECVLLY
jgi:hypothetical protein